MSNPITQRERTLIFQLVESLRSKDGVRIPKRKTSPSEIRQRRREMSDYFEGMKCQYDTGLMEFEIRYGGAVIERNKLLLVIYGSDSLVEEYNFESSFYLDKYAPFCHICYRNSQGGRGIEYEYAISRKNCQVYVTLSYTNTRSRAICGNFTEWLEMLILKESEIIAPMTRKSR
jgi:hypothetical protein